MSRPSRRRAYAVSLLALGWGVGGGALAQQAPQAQSQPQPQSQAVSAAQDAPTVVVTDQGSRANPSYGLGQGHESGVTRFVDASILDRAAGAGDVLQLFKLTPGVQFSMNEGMATRDDLRDLRPSELSISGGRPLDNLFILDGVGVNSVMGEDVSLIGNLDYDLVRGASPQTVWVDSDLVGSVALHDSNVSAEFGRFTGGVVQINTRDPAARFGVRAGYSTSSDSLARYHLSPSYTSTVQREKPAFDRERWNISADLPITHDLALLAAYSRSEATTYNQWSASLTEMANETFDLTNISQTGMLKLLWTPRDDLRLTAQVTHSPYESIYVRTAGRNTQAVNRGGGTTARFGASGARGEADWTLDLTYVFHDADKEAADWRFDVPGGAEPWCQAAATSWCEDGHVGAIRQRQADLSLTGAWSQNLFGGEFRLGFAMTDIDAEKSRRDGGVYSVNGNTAVRATAVGPNVRCASPTDISCVSGAYAYNRLVVYPAYDASVSLQSYALWAEYSRQWNGFDLRAGLRYDHETFLSNHTLSPRLSASRDLPWLGINATLGLNRYYGRSFLGYAIREHMTNTLTYGRVPTATGGTQVWSDNWVLNTVTIPTRYSGQDLKSPYNDEVSLALTGPLLGGQWQVKGVYREGHDLFSRSPGESFVLVDERGVSRTITRYNAANGGESRYESASLNYVKPWGRHSFSFSTAWSDTHYSADSVFDPIDDDVAGATMVVFQGRVMSLIELLDENQRMNFATPFMFNADWQSKWFDNRLSVTVGGRFRGEFDRIEQTSAFETIGGVRYRVYDVVHYDSSVDLDANLSFALVRGDREVTLDARISNLLDRIPNRNASYSSQPWQLGRNAWIGIRMRY